MLFRSYVCLICFAGTLIGMLTHGLFACLYRDAVDWTYYVALGCLHGLKYSGLWAGGAAIVLCVMRAHKEWSQE